MCSVRVFSVTWRTWLKHWRCAYIFLAVDVAQLISVKYRRRPRIVSVYPKRSQLWMTVERKALILCHVTSNIHVFLLRCCGLRRLTWLHRKQEKIKILGKPVEKARRQFPGFGRGHAELLSESVSAYGMANKSSQSIGKYLSITRHWYRGHGQSIQAECECNLNQICAVRNNTCSVQRCVCNQNTHTHTTTHTDTHTHTNTQTHTQTHRHTHKHVSSQGPKKKHDHDHILRELAIQLGCVDHDRLQQCKRRLRQQHKPALHTICLHLDRDKSDWVWLLEGDVIQSSWMLNSSARHMQFHL